VHFHERKPLNPTIRITGVQLKLFLPDRQRWHLRRRRKGEHENGKRTCEPRRKSENSRKNEVLKTLSSKGHSK
jgi:hypothetical protein